MLLDPPQSLLFDQANPQGDGDWLSRLAPLASAGHFDEMRGNTNASGAGYATNSGANFLEPTRIWSQFLSYFGDADGAELDARLAALERQIRDNGVTYNAYADSGAPQRPWALNLFPLLVDADSWHHIERGVLQRVRVLDALMADVYGPQRLLTKAMVPPALVQGHPGYLRAMHGSTPVGGTHLHIAAFDLARGPDGAWWVVSQRTQAPSGLGYLLENRLTISRLFPQAFANMQVQRLASTYRALIEGLRQRCAQAFHHGDGTPLGGHQVHIALLTPGPYSETYFEHAYLARYLGLTLVEGSDLTVRDQCVYLRTLQGLERVHALIKRLDDEFLDPLELRSDSTLGVPGLLQALRCGNVLVANSPGSAFLESPALLGFLPALAHELIGEELLLPALPTWWCGERAAMDDVLPQIAASVIKPTYPSDGGHPRFEAVLARGLDARQRDEWVGRIARQGDEYTVQAYMPLSQMPVWRGSQHMADSTGPVALRSSLLRVFAVATGVDAQGKAQWQVLPGGMARIASADEESATMRRGGSSADVWVQVDTAQGQAVDHTSLLPSGGMGLVASALPSLAGPDQRRRIITSRAGENLFWLGRYTERCENTVRLCRVIVERLNSEVPTSPALLHWLAQLALRHGLVLADVPPPTLASRVFERSLIAGLAETGSHTSVGFNLQALHQAAGAVRERLSQEQWKEIERALAEFNRRAEALGNAGAVSYSSLDALALLETMSLHLAAITGAQTDRMTRDDGWRLLSIGRHVDRLDFLSGALALCFESGAVQDESGFEAVLALFDSTITFHSQYQLRRDISALLDLLVSNADNPRSLGWVAQALRGRLDKLLAHTAANQPSDAMLRNAIPAPAGMDVNLLLQVVATDPQPQDARYPVLMDLLNQCRSAAWQVSDAIDAHYFTHSADRKTSVGA